MPSLATIQGRAQEAVAGTATINGLVGVAAHTGPHTVAVEASSRLRLSELGLASSPVLRLTGTASPAHVVTEGGGMDENELLWMLLCDTILGD